MGAMYASPDPVGDFCGNQVVEWTPLAFSAEFIIRMRKNQKRLLNIPSTRQAIGIPRFLTARYYRLLKLTYEDFIQAAVLTTPIEDQEIARQIAYEILFPPKSTPASTAVAPPTASNLLNPAQQDSGNDPNLDLMADLLADISNAGIDLNQVNSSQMLDDSMKDLQSLMDFLNDLYQRAKQSQTPQAPLVKILDLHGGFSEAMSKGIRNLQTLTDFIHKIVQREVDALSTSEIQSAVNLGWQNEVIQQSKVPWVQLTAQYCANAPDFQKNLQDVMKQAEVAAAARSARYLQEAGIDPSSIQEKVNQLVQRSRDLMDISDIARVLNHLPKFDQNAIFPNSLNRDLGKSFQVAHSLDSEFQSNIAEDLFQSWSQVTSKPSISDLFQAQVPNAQWRQLIDDAVKAQIQSLTKAQKRGYQAPPSTKLTDLSCQLAQLAKESSTKTCQLQFLQDATDAGMAGLELSQNPLEFETTLRTLLNTQIPLNETQVMQMGIQKGVPEETLLEIFGGNYDLLKLMMQHNSGNFNRYTHMLRSLKQLSNQQMQELMQIAAKNNNFQGMGALGHFDLSQAFNASQQMGGGNTRQLAESLTAGPGDNLLLQWFDHRHNIPAAVKNLVRQLVKDALVKIALAMLSSQRGSGEKGLVPSNKLRVFLDGDDMDLVDLETSVENIIMSGKSLEMIQNDDLLVVETEKGRVAICFLLDVSGSMTGEKLASCAIAVMILIGRLRAEEVAVAFFESNTHVVKTFGEKKDLEALADELLDLQSMGGTRVQAALEWGARQLKNTDPEMKLCFLLTDCEFAEDRHSIQKELEEYVLQKVKFIVGVNTRSFNQSYCQWILDTTKGRLVKIVHIHEIPKILTETLEKLS